MTALDPSPGTAPAAEELEAAARHVLETASAKGLRVRLMGGIAVRMVSPSARRSPYLRDYRDFDLVAHGKDAAAFRRLLESEGYVGDRLFNAIHGASRLMYASPDGRWAVDVVLDRLHMSHTIELRDRLATDGPTIDLADLLLTKLQIWETNAKDLGDAACLLLDHRVEDVGRLTSAPSADGTPAPIDFRRLRELLGTDWGLCHTTERNLRAIVEAAADPPDDAEAPGDADPRDEASGGAPGGSPHDDAAVRRVAAERATELLGLIEAAPKSMGWRARARIGERVPWYERPEEARR